MRAATVVQVLQDLGLVLSFIACFISLVIAPVVAHASPEHPSLGERVVDGRQQVTSDPLERAAAADLSRQQSLEHDEEELARHGAAVDTRLTDERHVQLTTSHQLHRSLIVQVEQTVHERV